MKTAKAKISDNVSSFSRMQRFLGIIVLGGLVLTVASFTALRTQADAAAQVPPELESLMASVQEMGSVRVIVGLDVSFRPEGDLAGPQAVRSQRQRIETTQDAVLAGMADSNATVIARFQYIPYMAFAVDADALAKLAALPQTTTFEEDVPSPPALASSIPVIGADDAWAAGYTGSGHTVAILDSGVEKTHSFFSTGGNRVISEACYSTNYVPHGATSVCPGGSTESTALGSGVNCGSGVYGCDHGTHVAGIAAGDDGIGPHIGVAKGASVIAVQIFSQVANCSGVGLPSPCALSYISDQIKGLERVYELRNTYDIAAANMSLGGGQYFNSASCDADNASRKAIIDNLRAAGIATIAASGNDYLRDSMGAPACISTAISVGATQDDDAVAPFSNIASFLDLLAPGVDINSSIPGNAIGSKPGTSMAAPHVTGAWAVVKQKAPSASVDGVLAALRNTGTSVDDNRIGGSVTDMRRINLDLALDEFSASLSITKTLALTHDPAWRGDPITYTIQVANNSGVAATGVHITDTLPMYVNGTDLDTTTTIEAGDNVSYTIYATVANNAPHSNTITNTAYYKYGTESGMSSAAFGVEDPAVHLNIDKTVTLVGLEVEGGDPITYTVVVANQGGLNATGVHITDTLPMYVTGNDLDTTTTVTAGESVTYTLYATVTTGTPPGTTITNVAYYDHPSGGGSSSAVFALLKYVFLPIVAK